jgi:Rv0078B-related antitoxin
MFLMKPQPIEKFAVVLELLELAERAFIYKLKRNRPNITDLEIEEEVEKWYRHRPGAEFGDGEGVPGDPKRFGV